jgi:cytochrome P450
VALPSTPSRQTTDPLLLLIGDVRSERAAEVPFPPGEVKFSMARTIRFSEDPLPLLLESYERFGPVFTLRLGYGRNVFMLGPEANHYITVSHASNFHWREGLYREMIPLIGNGLLTTDGDYHRRSRAIMLPAFHRESIGALTDVIAQQTEQALERFRPGARVDLYTWARKLALSITMRALLGLDSTGAQARGIDAAALSEQALSYYSSPYPLRLLRGPGTPWWHRRQAVRGLNRLLYAEISRRRATGDRGKDILSLLLDAHDEEGSTLTDEQVRNELMTLLFAGHDTTISTVTFIFYELARHPDIAARVMAEQDAKLAGSQPGAEELMGGELTELEMVIDETLRKYPPAWIGPRRSLNAFEFGGHTVPGSALVNYCSLASHHLPEVFPEPSEFRPERFAPEARAALPKGAYIPFGGGSRTCIGMRFGQLMIRTIATLILSRCTLELPEDYSLTISQIPTISPKGGLPLIVRERAI